MANTDVDDEARELAERRLAFYRGAQAGVFSLAQLRECLIDRHDLARMLRRRELTRVHPRVYVDHTGPLTRTQREWAALLYAEPAALCWRIGERKDDLIHVAVPHERQVSAVPGVQIHRVRGFEAMLDGRRLPALEPAHDALLMAHRAGTELEVVALIAAATAGGASGRQLRAALTLHHSLRRRRFVASLIDDVASGTHSVLEHGYLARVERPHGLPPLTRQVARRSVRGVERRDGEYEEFGLVIELDGRLNHESWAAGNRDAGRDLDDLASGRAVARLRYGQVFGEPCRTAMLIGRALAARGWSGALTPCGPGCAVHPG
jgi:hypothetical protein